MPSFSQQLNAVDVDHGTSRLTRWLRARWFSLGAWIALAEGILVVAHSLSKVVAIVIALAVLAVYFTTNRSSLPPSARIGARIIAVSQALVLLVPVLLFMLYAAAIVAVAVIAIVALAVLLRERR